MRTSDWQPDRVLAPNGYIAFALGYPMSPDLQRSMVLLARDQLGGRHGVRSLAPRDWPAVFPAAFLEDPHSHRGKDMASVGIFNYHRGIEWEWLNPFCVAAELECGDPDEAYRDLQRQPDVCPLLELYRQLWVARSGHALGDTSVGGRDSYTPGAVGFGLRPAATSDSTGAVESTPSTTGFSLSQIMA